MNRFIKSVSLFIPFAIVTYILLICIWGDFSPAFLKKNLNYFQASANGYLLLRIQEAKETKDVDILFLGSSHAYRGFDNRIFKNAGFRTFNFGSSAQTPIQTEILLKRYLNGLNPKTIIFEVDPGIFSNDGVESAIDLIANDENDENSIKMAFKLNNIKVYNSLIYSLYRAALHSKPEHAEYIKYDSDNYIPGGYVERDLAFFKHIDYGNKENKWNIKTEQLHSLENAIKLIKKHNIKIIFVRTPITHAFYKTFTNDDFFNKTMMSYGEYYNFNELIELDDSLHYSDDLHLNQPGVEIFNKKLIELLFKENK